MDLIIAYYETSEGVLPVDVFLEQVRPVKLAAKLYSLIENVAHYGTSLGGGYVEKCHSYADLWEIRAQFRQDLGRIFFTLSGDKMVLLSGFVKKKGQATPDKELKLAACYLDDFVISKRAR